MNIKRNPYRAMVGTKLRWDTRHALNQLVASEQKTISQFVRELIEREATRSLQEKESGSAAD